jgi:hypothetical protein
MTDQDRQRLQEMAEELERIGIIVRVLDQRTERILALLEERLGEVPGEDTRDDL